MSYTEEEFEAAWNDARGHLIKWGNMEESARADYRKFANALPRETQGKPIAREDIRKNDVVLRTATENETETTYKGTVSEVSEHGITLDDNFVFNNVTDADESAAYSLIKRPMPKLRAGQVIRVDAATNAYTYIVGLEFYILSIPDGSRFTGPTVEMRESTGVHYGVSPDAITAFTVLWPTDES